jgi:hypothetical protein
MMRWIVLVKKNKEKWGSAHFVTTNVWLLWLPIVHMAIGQFIVLLCI